MINCAELSAGDARNHNIAVDFQAFRGEAERAGAELGLVTDFISNKLIINEFYNRIHRLNIDQLDGVDVLCLGVVALRHVDDVLVGVFLHHEPRAAA